MLVEGRGATGVRAGGGVGLVVVVEVGAVQGLLRVEIIHPTLHEHLRFERVLGIAHTSATRGLSGAPFLTLALLGGSAHGA